MHHILVVEDNPDHWTFIQDASRQAMPNVPVVWAANAQAAFAHLETCLTTRQTLPRLMLLDLYLPLADQAWQLLRAVKQPGSSYLTMPVVVLSSSQEQQDIDDFYSFGGTSYIIKPTTYEQWLSYFETVRQYWWETVTLPKG